MIIGYFISYKGHGGSICVDGDKYYGSCTISKSVRDYEADSLINLQNEFHKFVDSLIESRIRDTGSESILLSEYKGRDRDW